jgi:Uma2 family endonuclease
MQATMATPSRRFASETDLLQMPRDGQKYELVDREIRMSPAGFRHGAICALVVARLVVFVRERRLGHVLDSSTGFRLPSGNVRCPDASFVASGRLDGDQLIGGFAPFPPDLAVEVMSPEDRSQALLDKVGEYLDAGVRLVWVIDPITRSATRYRALTDVRVISAEGDLGGEDVLPGFRCRLADVLD